MPPVYHEIVTGRLVAGHDRVALLAARDQLAHALQGIEAGMARGPSGLLVTVGWGMPYFREQLPRLRDGRRFLHYLPSISRNRVGWAGVCPRSPTRFGSRAIRRRPCSSATTSPSSCAVTSVRT